MAVIPLEDNFSDILGKAQRGLRVADAELARRAGVSAAEFVATKSGLSVGERLQLRDSRGLRLLRFHARWRVYVHVEPAHLAHVLLLRLAAQRHHGRVDHEVDVADALMAVDPLATGLLGFRPKRVCGRLAVGNDRGQRRPRPLWRERLKEVDRGIGIGLEFAVRRAAVLADSHHPRSD